jgi:hypothetical protein
MTGFCHDISFTKGSNSYIRAVGRAAERWGARITPCEIYVAVLSQNRCQSDAAAEQAWPRTESARLDLELVKSRKSYTDNSWQKHGSLHGPL